MPTGPPEDSQLVEMQQPGSCALDAREMKLVQLFGGEDPMLVKIDADEQMREVVCMMIEELVV